MWWFDPSDRDRGIGARPLLAVLLAFAVAGCGFRPLYGPPPTSAAAPERPAPAEQLAKTRVLPLQNREGQHLHNLLRDRLNPAGQPQKPAYALALTMTSAIQKLGIRKDETASRANLILDVSYVLKQARSSKVETRGRTRSVNSYNILDEFFATTVTQDDALKRGLREIADNIALRLAVHFAAAPEAAEASTAEPAAEPPAEGDSP